MLSRPFDPFTSTYVVLPIDNVDTDQIIPARFLKTIERTGLGAGAFHDWRYQRDGTPNADFPLNQPGAAEARILVTGRNFGCGSSREHAVWALLGAGFSAVVSAEFADIFRANALGNGLLPIQVDPGIIETLSTATRSGRPSLTVDLESQTLILPGGEPATFPIAPFAKHCLLCGINELDFLLDAADEVSAFEATHPARVSTLVAEEQA